MTELKRVTIQGKHPRDALREIKERGLVVQKIRMHPLDLARLKNAVAESTVVVNPYIELLADPTVARMLYRYECFQPDDPMAVAKALDEIQAASGISNERKPKPVKTSEPN